MVDWLAGASQYISRWRDTSIADANDTSSQPRNRGWSTQPDAAHNAAVEDAAIACVLNELGAPSKDRQRDNCGWDLVFKTRTGRLCIEVKGVSGSDIAVELTPNEYCAMKRAMSGTFREGNYRLAVVSNALTNPQLMLFAYRSNVNWHCERSGRKIAVTERVAARLQEDSAPANEML